MPLLSCECVKGLPIGEQLSAIYCATYTLSNTFNEGVLPVVNGGTGQSVLYKFHAYKSVDQALLANSTTKITFDTEEYDEGSAFSGSSFTAEVASKYLFGAACLSISDPSVQAIYLYKNGSQFKRFAQRTGVSSEMISGSVTIDLAAGDVVDVYMFTDQNTNIVGSSFTTYFWGQLVP